LGRLQLNLKVGFVSSQLFGCSKLLKPERIIAVNIGRPGSLLEQDALEACERDLFTILRNVRLSDDTVYCSVDASLPDNTQHQAVSAAILYREFEEFNRIRHIAGRVTAPDAELFAIHSAITLATQQDNCEKIYIFTDSIASARRAVDPSLHSGQGHSLAVCRTLAAWLAEDSSCTITFIQAPSKLEWSIHKEAHDYAKDLISPAGLRPATSLDSVQKAITKRSQETWTRMFEDLSYKGHNFLHLERLDRDALIPTYINGGVWLSPVGGNLSVAVRLFRCILNHAPIGSYYEWFNIPEPLACECGFHCQDCDHVLLSCNKHKRKANWHPHYLKDVVDFLEENPLAFSFRRPVVKGAARLQQNGLEPFGEYLRLSSGFWVRSQLGRASQCLGVELLLLSLLCT